MTQQPPPYQPLSLERALRETAARLRAGADYRWAHMGSCNCGHLAQTVSLISPGELHRRAVERPGDWSEQLRDYCPSSGLPLDDIIAGLLRLGATLDQLRDLERLSDRAVLAQLPAEERRSLSYRRRADVARYFEAWADLERARSGSRAASVAVPALR